jgi:hypothetical protein
MKLGKRFFYILLGALALILVAFGLLRAKYGPFLPPEVDKNLPDVVMFSAVGIMLWNRKILGDEKKAAAARKLEEEEAAAAKRAEAADPDTDPSADPIDDRSGTDAPR